MLILWIYFAIGVAGITARAFVYIQQHRKEEEKQIKRMPNSSEQFQTDPGAYLCELAQKGYIRFTLAEEKLQLILLNYPSDREGTVKSLFSKVFLNAAKMVSDDTAIVGREIIDYEEIKSAYRKWVNRNNPGNEDSKVQKKDQSHDVPVKTKFDRTVYLCLFSISVLMSAVSDTVESMGRDIYDSYKYMGFFVAWIVSVVLVIVGFRAARVFFEVDLESINQNDAAGITLKGVFFLLVTLFFVVVAGAIFVLVGNNLPSFVLKVYAVLVSVIILMIQKGLFFKKGFPAKLWQRWENRQGILERKRLISGMLKGEYIVDGIDLPGLKEKESLNPADRQKVKEQKYFVEKVLLDEKE